MSGFEVYSELEREMKQISYVGGASALLSWDEETYLPEKGRSFRAEQKAFLSGWAHEKFVDPHVGERLQQCIDSLDQLTPSQQVNVREWMKDYRRATVIPKSLVETFEKTRSETHHLWVDARKNSDFKKFAPGLQKLIDLSRQRAEAWGYDSVLYDALLEENEPGGRVVDLKPLFEKLKENLTPLVPLACERSQKNKQQIPQARYSVEKQQQLNERVAKAIGFDMEAGRIDTTIHPFCSGVGAGDCRLTTRYAEDQFLTSLYGVLHEAGHGMYEQGLREEAYGTPLALAVSLGIHESQSRFWENHVGRSRAFWEWLYPHVLEIFPHLKNVSCDAFYNEVNQVKPSLIRVEADPVTYDFHIILRFEIEQKLFSGEISVTEITEYWNECFFKMTGIRVPNDAQGALQDVHWSWGLFGYFPTYTLGNLNAAQIWNAMNREIGPLESRLEKGDFLPLRDWLREKIHRKGRSLLPQALIQEATSKPTGPDAHLSYLKEKFL